MHIDLEEDNQLSEDDESTEELDFADPDSPGFDDEGAMTPVSKVNTNIISKPLLLVACSFHI